MVLSIRAHELLTQNSKINSTQNDFKSLIPQNDIPDKKQVYHKNMLEISEKTIELKSKKTFKKREEIVIDKVGEEEEVEEESDDLEDVEDTLQFKLDDDSEDEDKEAEEVKEKVEEEEDKIEEGEEEEKDDDDKKLPDKDLMLDLIGIIEDKNKKEKKEDKEEPVEMEIKETNNTKKIMVDVPEDVEQSGGNIKKIKLDQHYNFF